MMRKALLFTALATAIGASTGAATVVYAAGQGGAASGQKAAAMFDRCDKNGDGSLTVDEFKSCHRDPARAERRFKRIDANDDGAVTRDEARQWAAQRKSSRSAPGGGAGPGAGQGGGGTASPGAGSSQ